MATRRGFVEALEIGRAGLASAYLLHGDGSRATYTIADLDADPERFNERLSKLGLLRDAMDRAEPVEIEFDQGGEAGGGAIDRVRRLTRDALEMPRDTDRATGLVIGLKMEIVAAPNLPEPTDRGTIALLVAGAVQRYVIPMQTPERVTADAMAAMARAAQADGQALTVEFDRKDRTIVSMESGSDSGVGGGGGPADRYDAFVEAIAHTPITDMMVVSLTTAPAFAGVGNVVPLDPFEPKPKALLVVRGAPEYALLEAALRDKLRVRVMAEGAEDVPDPPRNPTTGATVDAAGAPAGTAPNAAANAPVTANAKAGQADDKLAEHVRIGSADEKEPAPRPELVRGVQLLAPLCSASRPVWIQVDRRALDVGPDAICAEGLPSSDLNPRTMREIDLPYRAEWIGIGCFNHGVYRFELALSCQFAIFVDGRELCVREQEGEGQVRFAHACLNGDHEVRIVLEGWHCRKRFDMDVYRIR